MNRVEFALAAYGISAAMQARAAVLAQLEERRIRAKFRTARRLARRRRLFERQVLVASIRLRGRIA